MKVTGSVRFYAVTMVVMLVIIVLSVMMEYLESKLLPLVISSIVFVLAGIGLTREILARDKQGMPISKGRTSGGEAAGEGWHGYLLNIAWIVGFLLSIYLLGFTIAIALFVLLYMKWLGTRWRVAITCAILTPSVVYGLFEVALGIELYRGLVLTWLG